MKKVGHVEYNYRVADKHGRTMENADTRQEARILKKLYEVREKEPYYIHQEKTIRKRIR